MMIYSYAACFAAVTLRIWLPILTSILGEFLSAYRIVAWLCWVPNLIVAYIISNTKKPSKKVKAPKKAKEPKKAKFKPESINFFFLNY